MHVRLIRKLKTTEDAMTNANPKYHGSAENPIKSRQIVNNDYMSVDDIVDENCNTIFVNGANLTSDGKTLIKVDYYGNHYEIPQGVIQVGNGNRVFQSGWIKIDHPLLSVVIPETTESIGEEAFSLCYNLRTITFKGNNLKTIGNAAFSCCKNLKSMVIPDGVIEIGDDAFAACIALTTITIPDSVMNIGHNVFEGCSNLKEVFVSCGNKSHAVNLLCKAGMPKTAKIIEM